VALTDLFSKLPLTRLVDYCKMHPSEYAILKRDAVNRWNAYLDVYLRTAETFMFVGACV
jgi:hypothetical protein